MQHLNNSTLLSTSCNLFHERRRSQAQPWRSCLMVPYCCIARSFMVPMLCWWMLQTRNRSRKEVQRLLDETTRTCVASEEWQKLGLVIAQWRGAKSCCCCWCRIERIWDVPEQSVSKRENSESKVDTRNQNAINQINHFGGNNFSTSGTVGSVAMWNF